MNKRGISRILENLALVSHIGLTMVVPILGGILLGKFIDDIIGTQIIFLVIFTILGVVTAFLSLYKIATRGIPRK